MFFETYQSQGQDGVTASMTTLRSIAALAGLALAPMTAAAEDITVFAAASMANALTDIEAGFEAATGHDLVVSLAGSSALARQRTHAPPPHCHNHACTSELGACRDIP